MYILSTRSAGSDDPRIPTLFNISIVLPLLYELYFSESRLKFATQVRLE